VCASLGALCWVGCGDTDPLRDYFVDRSPREQYVAGLEAAGLDGSALAHDWVSAGSHALNRPTSVPTPYREAGYLDPAETRAEAFRFALRRGQRVLADVDVNGDSARLAMFVDLFVESDAADQPVLLATADSGTHRLEHVARRDGIYLLRIQPELLRGGRYTLTIEAGASLAFPVSGVDARAIRSGFGAPRDGGRREHHGVDIFAARGTPVVAASEAVVRRVATRGLGGKVVWLRDARLGYSLYYAHLDSQLVRAGMRVAPGDTIGLVGNTGNAHSTPPHLHFGIYGRGVGPVDPWPFVFVPDVRAPAVRTDLELIGEWRRVRGNRIQLRHPARAGAAHPRARRGRIRYLGARTPPGWAGRLPRRQPHGTHRPCRHGAPGARRVDSARSDRRDHGRQHGRRRRGAPARPLRRARVGDRAKRPKWVGGFGVVRDRNQQFITLGPSGCR
jgi:murein DD-endopeptidase MepM/ murein hydrolase activator NlpD